MMILHKNLSYYILPCYISHKTNLTSSSIHLLRTPLHFSTATSKNPSPQTPFMAEYLISSCGFSPDKAIEVSKYLTHLKSPSKPDSVIHFLKQRGLSDTHITSVIRRCPMLLGTAVEKTLKPKMTALQEMGFSEPELIRLVSGNPHVLLARDIRPKIDLWRTLLGTNENLLKASRRDDYFFTFSLGKRIMPNLSFLRECGLSDHRISKLILNAPRLIARNLNSIKALVKRAEQLGVFRGSGSFWKALRLVFSISRATFDAKIKLLKSLGWSEADVVSAIQKDPFMLMLSEKNIRNTLDFLLNEVGCKLSYVALHPVLLSCSLERRLIPRHCVLRILKLNELPMGELDLFNAIAITEKKFVEKFVLPHKEKVPGLHEAYVAACAGKVPAKCEFYGETVQKKGV